MNITLLSIEILTTVLAIGLLVIGLLVPKGQWRGISYLTTIGLTGILISTLAFSGVNETLFNGMYVIDPLSTFFKQIFLLAAVLVSLASYDYILRLGYNQAEFFSLLVFATLGMMVLASSGDLISLYVGLELMTITFIILTAYRKKDAKASEAGIKYLILGAMSSAVLLYGLSFVYGAAGSTVFSEIAAAMQGGIQPLMVLGTIFVIAGFAFKISAVPFHMWSPDIYEGAPTPVTAFLAVASKAAGFAAMIRILVIALPALASDVWLVIVIVLAALTVLFGNFVAIPQTNIKRLLAFSSIAQAGYLLFGLVAFSALGIAAILFHSILYVFANMGAFIVAISFYNHTGSDEIKDYTGLAQRSPFMAAVMLLSLLSLAGIPPLAGFVSKFYLFTAIIEKGYLWLAFLGIGMSMVSVYYYLMVVKVMYLGEPVEGADKIKLPFSVQAALLICMIVSVFFGIYPEPLTNVALNVAHVFFPF
ncbi:NADH-quinone oxidoreductase subunit N [Metallumcola ferriviriculae]|uniref:NADH-quinone oxidoreductase subunit N n=1 Tax=Metallumcola ferriviriculae TaxID=3039180 RepID=A0AAU0UNN7_9FIRM|nr:NADH-quinone oxidoreductase subunit N [Desulfitibacteraceae bacterium MK1]